MPKQRISLEEYQTTEAEAKAAKEFLEDERFQFIRDYINNSLTSAEQAVLNNTIREVQEIVPISEKLTRIFKQPKKEQVDELAGQYKWIKKFMSDMEFFARGKEDMDDAIEKKVVILEAGNDEPAV